MACPEPRKNVSASNVHGDVRPEYSRAASAAAATSIQASDTSMTMRRSHISAAAPASNEETSSGAVDAAWTSATISADGAMVVIAQAAPTDCTQVPMLENSDASQIARKMGTRNGARVEIGRGADRRQAEA